MTTPNTLTPLTPAVAQKEAEALRRQAGRLEAVGEGTAARQRRRAAQALEMNAK